MKRRSFIVFFSALLGLALSTPLLAIEWDYEPGLLKRELATGKPVLVDYAADWCGTCKRQERILRKLRTDNAEYDKQLTFVRVDWDDYQGHEVTTSRNIPRRSTLILLKGDEELGRIVAGTDVAEIQALLDKGLAK